MGLSPRAGIQLPGPQCRRHLEPQHIFRDNLVGNLAADSTGDGSLTDRTARQTSRQVLLMHARDGVQNGVIGDPLARFQPIVDLSDLMCPSDKAGSDCFTTAQLQTINDLYNGPPLIRQAVYPGKMFGSDCDGQCYPWQGNASIKANGSRWRSHELPVL